MDGKPDCAPSEMQGSASTPPTGGGSLFAGVHQGSSSTTSTTTASSTTAGEGQEIDLTGLASKGNDYCDKVRLRNSTYFRQSTFFRMLNRRVGFEEIPKFCKVLKQQWALNGGHWRPEVIVASVLLVVNLEVDPCLDKLPKIRRICCKIFILLNSNNPMDMDLTIFLCHLPEIPEMDHLPVEVVEWCTVVPVPVVCPV